MKNFLGLFLFCLLFNATLFAQQADSLLKLADVQTHLQKKSELYLQAARAKYFETKQLPQAFQIADKAIATNPADEYIQMLYHDQKGYLHRKNNEFLNAISEHLKAVEIGEKNSFNLKLARIYNNLAVAYRRTDDYKRAIEFHTKAMNLAQTLQQDDVVLYAINGLGNSYIAIEKYREAILYFNEAYDIALLNNNTLSQAINLNNIGEAYQQMGEYNKASIYFQQSLELNQQMNNQTGIAISYNSLGTTFLLQHKYDQAIAYFQLAKEINHQIESDFYYTFSILNLADAYLAKQQLNRVTEQLNEAEPNINTLASKALKKRFYQIKKEYYQQQADYKNALLFQEKATNLNDSILNEEYLNRIAFFNQQFDLQKKESKILLLEKEKQNTSIQSRARLLSIVGVSLTLIAVLTAIFLWKQNNTRRKSEKILTQKNQQIRKTNQELQTQIQQKTSLANQLQKSLTDKDELIVEIHHRVKNNLAIISAMLQMEELHASNDNEKRLLSENANRIKAMAIIQDQLYQNKTQADINIKNFLTSYFDFISQKNTITRQINFEFNIHSPIFKLTLAVPFGLLVNELLNLSTNVIGNKPENLTIKLEQFQNYFVLQYKESYNEPNRVHDFPVTETLIETIVLQLKGTLDIKKTQFKRLISIEFENRE